MSMRFSGEVAIVTGGTSGIGRAVAIALAMEGARVAIAGRREKEGLALVEEINSVEGEAVYIKTDVRDTGSVAAMVRETVRRYGRLDCAVNNAGISGANGKTAEQSESSWDEVMDTNLKGVWLCMKHEIPEMLKFGGGSIVNTASIFSFIGAAYGIAPYIASKHGVLGLTRAAAMEYASVGIRVNAVCPGFVQTEMIAPALRENPERFRANIETNVPLQRLADPREIARAVAWVCSKEASFVTGQSLSVDGGWLAH